MTEELDLRSDENEEYRKSWQYVFTGGENLRKVTMEDGKGGVKVVHATPEQYEIFLAATAPVSKLEALTRVMQRRQDEEEGKTYSTTPVPLTSPAGNARSLHEEFRAVTMETFRKAGYVVTTLFHSPFDFVAQLGQGKNSKTYYVIAKCGKNDSRRPLSQHRLRRMRDQHLNPRFGTNVTKLYWYACTADNTHRTYEVGMHGGYGMKPIPHPIAELAQYMAPTDGHIYQCTVRRKKPE